MRQQTCCVANRVGQAADVGIGEPLAELDRIDLGEQLAPRLAQGERQAEREFVEWPA